jgi:hypothetical protein
MNKEGSPSDSDASYTFGSGIGEDEIARLEHQGAIAAPGTRMVFAEAGIRPGMRVLDLGCGAGDSTFVAADLVGPGGSVTGLDHSPEALARPGCGLSSAAWPRCSSSRATITTRRRAARTTRSSNGWPCIRSRTRPRSCDGRPPCCARAAWSWRQRRPLNLAVAAPDCALYPVGVLGDRGAHQGPDALQWPAAVDHPRRGGAAPAGDDRNPDPSAPATRPAWPTRWGPCAPSRRSSWAPAWPPPRRSVSRRWSNG